MKAEFRDTFKGNINGLDIREETVYFTLKTILESMEQARLGYPTNDKEFTTTIYLNLLDKWWNTTPADFEEYEIMLTNSILTDMPEEARELLNYEFKI